MMTRKFYRGKAGHYHTLMTNPKEHEVGAMTQQNYFNTSSMIAHAISVRFSIAKVRKLTAHVYFSS